MKIRFYFILILSSLICSNRVSAQTYCFPSTTANCTAQDDINTFTLIGANSTAFLDTNTHCSSGGYDNRTGETPVDLIPGNTYSGYINSDFFTNEYVHIWIDFNDDSTFSSSESVGTISNVGTSLSSYSISIPTGVNGGSHRMRVRMVYATTASSIDPCSNYYYGETHDYTVIVGAAAPTITGNTVYCSGNSLTLTASTTAPNPVYNWTGPNSFSGTGATIIIPNLSSLNAGTYSCTVTALGTTSTPTTVGVVVNQSPSTPIVNNSGPLCAGDSLHLYDTVNNTAGLTYSWTGPAGFTSTLQNPSIPNSGTANAGIYTLVVTQNGCPSSGGTTVAAINIPPAIVLNPFNAAICPSGTTGFAIVATGSTGYQWQVNTGSGFNNITNNTVYSGATTNHLVLTGATNAMAGYLYRCIVSSACGVNATSTAASLNIYSAASISSQPSNDTVCEGSTSFLTFGASGSALQYQWQVNYGAGFVNLTVGGGIAGVYADTLVITYVPLTMNGAQIRCQVTAGGCSPVLQTTPITMVVRALPVVVTQPVTNTTCAGGNASYSVVGTGYQVNYQWQVNSGSGYTNITNSTLYSGATSTTLNITGATAAMNNYNYRCVLTGFCAVAYTNATPLFITAAPNATITPTGSTTFCPTDSLLIVAGQNTIYSYQWQLNGSNISGAVNPSYTAHTGGTYSVVISYGNNCSVTSSNVVVTILTAPASTITAAGPLTFCQGGSVTLNGNTGSGLSYIWYQNGIQINGAISSSFTATSSGSYTLNTYNGYCHTNSNATFVVVNPVPAAAISYTGTGYFCTGSSILLPANTASNTNYQWLSSGGPINGATNPTFNTSTAGTYRVVETTTSGCIDTSASVTLTAAPVPPTTVTVSGSTTICAGNSVTLTGPSAAGLTYQWFENGNPVTNGASSSLTATTTGSYILRVTNMNGQGCTASSGITNVTVNNNTLPPASITYTGNPIICYGSTLTLNANTGTGYSYVWEVDSTVINGAISSSYIAHNSGHYEVTITDQNGCTGMSSIISVAIDTPLNPTVTITNGIARTGNGYSTYQWYKNMVPIGGATSYSYTTNNIAGSYTVEVTDPAGCKKMSNPVVVVGISTINVYNNDISIYPNPASSIIYIQAAINVNVTIYSMQGKMILHKDNAKDMNISELANGIYMVQVFDENNNLLKVERFVKNN